MARFGTWLRLLQELRRARGEQTEPGDWTLWPGVLRPRDLDYLIDALESLVVEFAAEPDGLDERELPQRIAHAMQLDGAEAQAYRRFLRDSRLVAETFREARKDADCGTPGKRTIVRARKHVARRHGLKERTVRRAFRTPGPHDD